MLSSHIHYIIFDFQPVVSMILEFNVISIKVKYVCTVSNSKFQLIVMQFETHTNGKFFLFQKNWIIIYLLKKFNWIRYTIILCNVECTGTATTAVRVSILFPANLYSNLVVTIKWDLPDLLKHNSITITYKSIWLITHLIQTF